MPPDSHDPADPSQHEILPMSTADRGEWTAVRPKVASLMEAGVLEALSSKMQDLLATGRRRIVLDFKEVEYMSSSAVGFLVSLRNDVDAAGGRLVVCGLRPRLRELLALTKLDRLLTIEPDVRTALKNVGAV